MMNIDDKLSFSKSNKKQGIYFINKNICVKCGCAGSLKFIDKDGDINYSPKYTSHNAILCTECGTKYYIKWVKYNNKMYPCAVDGRCIEEFNG